MPGHSEKVGRSAVSFTLPSRMNSRLHDKVAIGKTQGYATFMHFSNGMGVTESLWIRSTRTFQLLEAVYAVDRLIPDGTGVNPARLDSIDWSQAQLCWMLRRLDDLLHSM
jgi:hypothetical protein